jgi:methylthioribose-1-phosphate isomerase
MPEQPDPRTPAAPQPPGGDGADLARRHFFRSFASELFSTAATVVGAAQALQQSSADMARTLLNGESREAGGSPAPAAARPLADTSRAAPPRAPGGFRTAFRWDGDILWMIDQRRLPADVVEFEATGGPDVVRAIRDMVIRGAPAIGQAAAIGLALTAGHLRRASPYDRRLIIRLTANGLREARPTAVNLAWAIDRMLARYAALPGGELTEDGDAIADALRSEAESIVFEATTDHGRLADFGLAALPQVEGRPLELLTHCNTGPLACGQFGTALGVIQAAHHAERQVHVWVDETRPYLQGARLTAWELGQAGVPHTLVADGAAGWLLANGRVDAILVGADRVAANGDTANKIGTYPLAVLAARHRVPFFVCAPMSSIDLATPDGAAIPIEMRPPGEVLVVRGSHIAPPMTDALNPAFDITPAELITAIVTDEGVLHAPFEVALRDAQARSIARRRHPPAFAGFVSDSERVRGDTTPERVG